MRLSVFFSAVLVLFSVSLCNGQTEQDKNYGNAIVKKVSDCCDLDLYSFKCDIKNFPPIIGKNITVKINGISTLNEPNNTDIQKISSFVIDRLSKAKLVKLKNLRRGRKFAIWADVYCDRHNLAELLIEKRFAEKGKRLESISSFEKNKAKKPLQENRIVGSKNSKVFHKSSCHWTHNISKENLVIYKSRSDAIEQDKRPCKACKP